MQVAAFHFVRLTKQSFLHRFCFFRTQGLSKHMPRTENWLKGCIKISSPNLPKYPQPILPWNILDDVNVSNEIIF